MGALALLATLLLAAPVLQAPSERIFGMETVGRHHDPFTVMAQLAQPAVASPYAQPVTDVPGRLMVRALGPVAGYNLLVLLTFPLAASAAYLLARHLTLPPPFALIAGVAFAFAPFHLAQAAYHVHVAQTQWIALYLLALWRALDRGAPAALLWLAAAIVGVTLSNFYGSLIAAVITPIAALGYWAVLRHTAGAGRHLSLVVGTLVILAGGGLALAWLAGHPAVVDPAGFGYPAADIPRYGAQWWSYFVPPLAHPLLGSLSAGFFNAAGIREGRLEQQVALGWGFLALAAAALVAWLRRDSQTAPLIFVPVLAVVAVVAFACSVAGGVLHSVVPMFRSFARFGVVVQLMTVLLAAIGAHRLWTSGRRPLRIACAALLAAGAAEYAVWPPSGARDVLPTAAHRWIMEQPGALRALDCAPLSVESGSVDWLSNQRISMRSQAFDECTAPDLAGRLAAGGYTHVIVRRGTPDARWIRTAGLPAGLTSAARFKDGQVFTASAAAATVYTARVNGFYPREYDNERTWLWMGAAATWDVMNTSAHTLIAALDVELSAFAGPRRLRVRIDGDEVQTIHVAEGRSVTRLESLILGPGRHTLTFEPLEPSGRATGGDSRTLSFAFGPWQWRVETRP